MEWSGGLPRKQFNSIAVLLQKQSLQNLKIQSNKAIIYIIGIFVKLAKLHTCDMLYCVLLCLYESKLIDQYIRTYENNNDSQHNNDLCNYVWLIFYDVYSMIQFFQHQECLLGLSLSTILREVPSYLKSLELVAKILGPPCISRWFSPPKYHPGELMQQLTGRKM